MVKSKAETFIGFCIKARKISFGSGAIDTLKNGVYALIVSDDAADNTKKLAVKYSKRFDCPLIFCKTDFEKVVNRAGCKMVALKDRQLAKAVLENLDNDYELYAGGTN